MISSGQNTMMGYNMVPKQKYGMVMYDRYGICLKITHVYTFHVGQLRFKVDV